MDQAPLGRLPSPVRLRIRKGVREGQMAAYTRDEHICVCAMFFKLCAHRDLCWVQGGSRAAALDPPACFLPSPSSFTGVHSHLCTRLAFGWSGSGKQAGWCATLHPPPLAFGSAPQPLGSAASASGSHKSQPPMCAVL